MGTGSHPLGQQSISPGPNDPLECPDSLDVFERSSLVYQRVRRGLQDVSRADPRAAEAVRLHGDDVDDPKMYVQVYDRNGKSHAECVNRPASGEKQSLVGREEDAFTKSAHAFRARRCNANLHRATIALGTDTKLRNPIGVPSRSTRQSLTH